MAEAADLRRYPLSIVHRCSSRLESASSKGRDRDREIAGENGAAVEPLTASVQQVQELPRVPLPLLLRRWRSRTILLLLLLNGHGRQRQRQLRHDRMGRLAMLRVILRRRRGQHRVQRRAGGDRYGREGRLAVRRLMRSIRRLLLLSRRDLVGKVESLHRWPSVHPRCRAVLLLGMERRIRLRDRGVRMLLMHGNGRKRLEIAEGVLARWSLDAKGRHGRPRMRRRRAAVVPGRVAVQD